LRRLLSQPLGAGRAEEHDLFRSPADRLCRRELERGLTPVRWELRDGDALSRQPLYAGLAERVHVADDQVGKHLPALECERATVGGDDEVVVPDDGTIRWQHVAVTDYYRAHSASPRATWRVARASGLRTDRSPRAC